MFFIFLQFALIACQDFSSNDNVVVGNIKKRAQIPLYQINRRFSDNLNYRKTKDIRDEGIERKIEERLDRDRKEKLDGERYDVYNDYKHIGSNRDELFNRNLYASLTKKRNEVFDTKKSDNDIISDKQNTWDRRDDNFERKRDEIINRQLYEATENNVGEIFDRRFEQTEREVKRLGDAQDKLESLQKELRWLTINTEEGIGIGI